MRVTKVNLKPSGGTSHVVAYASIVLDNSFAVHDIRVVDSPNGLVVAMPSKPDQNGGHQDVAHPIRSRVRREIDRAVLRELRGEYPDLLPKNLQKNLHSRRFDQDGEPTREPRSVAVG